MYNIEFKSLIIQENEKHDHARSKMNIKKEQAEGGAAGLWARNLNHQSFTGSLSPTVKFVPGDRPMTALSNTPHYNLPTNFFITNQEDFVCSLCEMFIVKRRGVVLKSCRHNFCRECLLTSINRSKTAQVHCPMKIEACNKMIRDEEVQALLSPEQYLQFIEKCFQFADSGTLQNNALHELRNVHFDYEYVENRERFNCAICLTDILPGEGLILKNCLHEYCKTCLTRTIEMSDELEVPCPFVAAGGTRCEGFLQDCELRSLINEAAYSVHLGKSLARAEAITKNAFHCKTPDCLGWAEICGGVLKFPCPVCKKSNCIKCEAIHEGKTCEEYFYESNADARKARDNKLTKNQLKELIASKQAMPCPGCGIVIQKTVGCNHMKCTRCKLDFQWLGLN